MFVKVISICYCGNGKGYKEGVDERALPYYKKYIEMFELEEIREFLNLFNDHEFVTDLHTNKADSRMRKLAKILKQKSKDIHVNRALDFIINFPVRKLSSISSDHRFKDIIKYI